MSGSVIQRNGTEVVDQRIIHDDQPVAWPDADVRAGFRLDRRKVWAFIEGKLHEICRWTQACSGCSYEGDYSLPKRGGGCEECGHQGVVRNAMWIPYSAKDPPPMTDDLVGRLEAWADNDAEYGHHARSSDWLAAKARIEALEAENRKLRRLARATEIRMRTACDHTKAGKDHVKVRIADWHVLMNIGLAEAPAALTPEPSHAD